LTVYMSAYLGEALNDLTTHGETPPADLFLRFLGWVRPSVVGLTVEPESAPDDR
jgi:hypothetical protein